MNDRAEFQAARDAGLKKRHAKRLAHRRSTEMPDPDPIVTLTVDVGQPGVFGRVEIKLQCNAASLAGVRPNLDAAYQQALQQIGAGQ